MKVAFLARYRQHEGASSRVRVYQYVEPLERLGLSTRVLAHWAPPTRAARLGYVGRALRLARWADVLVLQKPNQPPWMIDLLASVNGRMIVDFDDAVWSPVFPSDDGRVLETFRRLERRLLHAIRRAGWVTTASRYLEDWVLAHNPDAIVTRIPESVDLASYPRFKEVRRDGSVVVGWSGSPGNATDLLEVAPVLKAVVDGTGATFRIISGERPRLAGVDFEYYPWTPETELEGLLGIDVGIMPLHDNERSWGRCGFKAIQYMAAGLPVVASPIGGAPDVVIDGRTGYLAGSPQVWEARLRELIATASMRERMGTEGRRRAEEVFSVQANLPLLVDLFTRRAAGRRRASGG